jgi:hypothetical protein
LFEKRGIHLIGENLKRLGKLDSIGGISYLQSDARIPIKDSTSRKN